MKKFYIETFGCQMNVHDSEKVIGTLAGRGYEQVETAGGRRPVLYNTCSIRDKAEQKVFHRLDQFKREHNGKMFGVLGCVAQQEGEKIFERAPHVEPGLRIGKLQQAARDAGADSKQGERRVTGLSLDTEDTFETPLTRRDNPHRAYHHDHRRLRQILRLLRRPFHARSGAQPHLRKRDAGGASAGRAWATPKFSCSART